jgi:methylglutaconyl-CoA hydratase
MKLITRLAPANEVDQIALDMARQVMQNAPGATMRTKMLMRELSRHHLSEDLKLVLAYHLQARTSEEAQEGVSAFLEKRDPRWD